LKIIDALITSSKYTVIYCTSWCTWKAETCSVQ